MQRLFVTAALVLLVACGSESSSEPAGQAPTQNAAFEPPPSDAPREQAPATPETPPPSKEDAGGGDADAGSPPIVLDPPQIDLLQTAPTGVKIGWYNTPTCDEIDGEWKSGLESYHQVFSVAGNLTQTIDISPASVPNHSSSQFTYRIRCKKGSTYSPYSNELSAFGPP